jgi:hypothetical protein
MATLPWASAPAAAGSGEVTVLGSRLLLRRARDVPGFLRAAMQVRAQVRRSPGALGVSLVARPLRREFWTLSAWTGEDAIGAFVRTEPHAGVMRRYHDKLATAAFATFTQPASAVPKANSNAKDLWRQARERLATGHEGAKRRPERR